MVTNGRSRPFDIFNFCAQNAAAFNPRHRPISVKKTDLVRRIGQKKIGNLQFAGFPQAHVRVLDKGGLPFRLHIRPGNRRRPPRGTWLTRLMNEWRSPRLVERVWTELAMIALVTRHLGVVVGKAWERAKRLTLSNTIAPADTWQTRNAVVLDSMQRLCCVAHAALRCRISIAGTRVAAAVRMLLRVHGFLGGWVRRDEAGRLCALL